MPSRRHTIRFVVIHRAFVLDVVFAGYLLYYCISLIKYDFQLHGITSTFYDNSLLCVSRNIESFYGEIILSFVFVKTAKTRQVIKFNIR